ncbi:hypothetical protein EMCRGX_G028987 [Ephydatia muelleri]
MSDPFTEEQHQWLTEFLAKATKPPDQQSSQPSTSSQSQSQSDYMLKEIVWPIFVVLFEDDIPHMHYQQDGAPAHYLGGVGDWLNETFGTKLIGRGGPLEWPARSPDLTPMDFWLWGYLKEKVYAHNPKTVDQLQVVVAQEMSALDPAMIQWVCVRSSYGINPLVGQGIDPLIGRGIDPLIGRGINPLIGRDIDPLVSRGIDLLIGRGVSTHSIAGKHIYISLSRVNCVCLTRALDHVRIISIEDVSFEETMLPKKLKDKAWEDHPAKKGMRSLVASIIDIPVYFSSFPERLKVVCVETNKTHDVMSKALETEDRDYVTEDDLTVGNELILPEAQPAGPSGSYHSPEYFLTDCGLDLWGKILPKSRGKEARSWPTSWVKEARLWPRSRGKEARSWVKILGQDAKNLATKSCHLILGMILTKIVPKIFFAGIQERHQCRTSASGLNVFREWLSFSLRATPTKPQRCFRTRHQLSEWCGTLRPLRAWVAYDTQYCRETLANRNLNWSRINSRLYNEAFTRRAKAIPRCKHCLGDTHLTANCSLKPNIGVAHPESTFGASTPSSSEICRNYNAG